MLKEDQLNFYLYKIIFIFKTFIKSNLISLSGLPLNKNYIYLIKNLKIIILRGKGTRKHFVSKI